MNKLSVKPAPGLKVLRPASEGGTYLDPDTFTDVPNTEFWRRRRDAGDVVEPKTESINTVEAPAEEAPQSRRRHKVEE